MRLHNLAAGAPDNAIAVVDAGGSLSYAQLRRQAGQIAHWLVDRGVSAGQRVLVHGTSPRAFAALLFGSSRAGAVFVPVQGELTAHQVHHIAIDSGCRLVISDHPEKIGGLGVPVWHPDDVLAAAAGGPWEEWAAAEVGAGYLALLIYTSGTTGTPKGVMCPHSTVLAAVNAIQERLGYRSDDVIGCRLPLAFDYGLYQLLLAAQVGATVCVTDRSRDLAMLDLVASHRVSIVPLVPSLARMILALARRQPHHTRIRLFTNTGARLDPDLAYRLLEAFPGSVYASMYGMTECKRITILAPSEFAAHPDSVGTAIRGDAVSILDAAGRALPPGVEGDIVVRGATVMAGYWNVPLAAQNRFRPGPDGLELHTGDRGMLDQAGRLTFCGRTDDIIKHHGVRLSLLEIEAAAQSLPDVEEAIALRPIPADGPLRLAYTGTADRRDLLEGLRGLLDPARIPADVVAVDTIPLTPNGKPDRAALRRQLTGDTHRTTTSKGHDRAPLPVR